MGFKPHCLHFVKDGTWIRLPNFFNKITTVALNNPLSLLTMLAAPTPFAVEKTLIGSFPHHHLYFLPDTKSLMMVPQGRVPHEEFKAVHMECLQLFHEYRPTSLIVDERNIEHINAQSRRWMVSNFMRLPSTRAIAKNHLTIIIIRPQSPLVGALTRAMHKIISSFTPFSLNYVPDEEEAYAMAFRNRSLT